MAIKQLLYFRATSLLMAISAPRQSTCAENERHDMMPLTHGAAEKIVISAGIHDAISVIEPIMACLKTVPNDDADESSSTRRDAIR